MLRKTVLSAVVILLPGLASAVDELSYNYVDVGYASGEIDVLGFDIDTKEIFAEGSIDLTDTIALIVGATSGEIETKKAGSPPDIDTRTFRAGITPHFPVGNNVDVLIPLAIVRFKGSKGRLSDTDTGYSIGVGVRALVTPSIELEAGLLHVDVNSEDDQSANGRARYHFSDVASVALGASYGDDVKSLFLSGRYSF